MEQFQINECRLVHAIALHTLQRKQAFLSRLFFLGGQQQRPKPNRGSSIKFSIQRGSSGGRYANSQFHLLLSKWRTWKSETQSTEASMNSWGSKKCRWLRLTVG